MLWLVHLLHRFRVVRSAAQVELARLVVYITMAVIIGAGAFLLVSAGKETIVLHDFRTVSKSLVSGIFRVIMSV